MEPQEILGPHAAVSAVQPAVQNLLASYATRQGAQAAWKHGLIITSELVGTVLGTLAPGHPVAGLIGNMLLQIGQVADEFQRPLPEKPTASGG